MSPLSVDERRLVTGVLVTVAGEADSTNADWLESSVESARRPGEPLVLDLSGLTFMDSSGLQVLLRLNAATRVQGGVLHLAAVQDLPARVLQISGVWDALNIHTGVEEAVAVVLHDHETRLQERQ
ncbi:STAS domain-containing protein [Nonomuraea zeae]|uniref:Anti-sigma factor antagonist n=1 Tax=Nonomuraea zeae TaxID=1642303 RepID=A0A5S4GVV8_9ACTN|nr:STAS domain-containing protein [Nonomuraea zeae]TMR36584.1 STAS domain-containing protein [Nonomuraea zeae]